MFQDAYRIYSESTGDRPVEVGEDCRDVLPSTASSRATHETSRPGALRDPQTTRSGRRHGVESPLHGDAGGAEDGCHDDDQLYAGLHEIERQVTRRILELAESQVTSWSQGVPLQSVGELLLNVSYVYIASF